MGWATVWPFSAGARGSGTILKVSLPFRLAYYGTVEEGSHSRFRVQNLCFESRLHLIALKLKASIIYAKWKCERRLLYYIKNIALPIYYPRCYWEDWEEYKSFGEIEAIDETYHLASNCPLPPSFGSIKVKLR